MVRDFWGGAGPLEALEARCATCESLRASFALRCRRGTQTKQESDLCTSNLAYQGSWWLGELDVLVGRAATSALSSLPRGGLRVGALSCGMA